MVGMQHELSLVGFFFYCLKGADINMIYISASYETQFFIDCTSTNSYRQADIVK